MPFFYRVTFTASYLGCTIQNVVHMQDKTPQGGTPVTPQQIAQDVAGNWLAAEQTLHQSSFRWSSVACSQVRTLTPLPAHIEPVNFPGAGVTESHSVTCIKIRWITARGGRRGFGKYYIGGINWALIEGGNNLSSNTRNILLGFMASIEGRYMSFDAGPVPFQMVLLHKDLNDTPDLITTADFYSVLGVQRRRNKFVGI